MRLGSTGEYTDTLRWRSLYIAKRKGQDFGKIHRGYELPLQGIKPFTLLMESVKRKREARLSLSIRYRCGWCTKESWESTGHSPSKRFASVSAKASQGSSEAWQHGHSNTLTSLECRCYYWSLTLLSQYHLW